jgi:hypothetical protein
MKPTPIFAATPQTVCGQFAHDPVVTPWGPKVSSSATRPPKPTLTNFGRYARYDSEQASELKDAASAAIFTEIGRGIDKRLWFVETSQ